MILRRLLPAAPLVALALLSSCGEREAQTPPATPAAAAPASPPAAGASPNASEAVPSGEATAGLDRSPLGVFAGTLPCADCDGLQTELTLYLEPDRFELKETRVGGSSGGETRTSQGPWATLTGTPSDANATVVQLGAAGSGAPRNFLEVGGDRLELLDENLNPLQAGAPHALVRKAEDEEGR